MYPKNYFHSTLVASDTPDFPKLSTFKDAYIDNIILEVDKYFPRIGDFNTGKLPMGTFTTVIIQLIKNNISTELIYTVFHQYPDSHRTMRVQILVEHRVLLNFHILVICTYFRH